MITTKSQKKVKNYKKLKKEEKYGTVCEKSAEKMSSLRIKKGGEKFPWAFSSSKQCRKKNKNVENYKKQEKEDKYNTV